jgi:hypothetical protein
MSTVDIVRWKKTGSIGARAEARRGQDGDLTSGATGAW